MLEKLQVEKVLFLDIETVPLVYKYDDLEQEMRQLWDARFAYNPELDGELQYKKAGIYAEFSKVVCVSVGLFSNGEFRVKSFFGDDESLILEEFVSLLKLHYNHKNHLLCAHNGKEFDFPFLCRRMLLNGIAIPNILNISGKKPWEVRHLDTMEMWKFGDYKSYTSLALLASVFNIPTPKDDIDGSDVARVYWEEKDLQRIVTYCQKDVATVAQLLLRFLGKPIMSPEKIIIA